MTKIKDKASIKKWLKSTNISSFYINGSWQEPEKEKKIDIKNPATNEIIAQVGSATIKDVEKAIKAARKAFEKGDWNKFSVSQRSDVLHEIANKIEEKTDDFAEIETLNNGKTLNEAKSDIEGAIETFRYYAGIIRISNGETLNVEEPFTSKVVREPVGVCGLIIPWNYPLLMAAWKLAPALAAGNTCILKPSEVTPLTAIRLFEIFENISIPPGVVNLINGTGNEAGNALVESNDISKIAFTGGTVTGKKIMQNSVNNLKNVSLELGGKSANIIFADADYDVALDHATFAIFNNSGEVCSAGSRLLVQKDIYDEFVKDLIIETKKIKVGNGFDPSTEMGPLVSEEQIKKIQYYVDIGKKEAILACGGKKIEDNDKIKGNFFEPTIFVDVDSKARIAQEEIFGPVLVVIPFDTEEEAIQIANDSPFGLAAGIFTSNGAKGERVSRALRVGVTWINTYEQNLIEGPWGGYKQSGIGRELGTYGLEEYTEIKQIINNLKVEKINWFSKES